MERKLTITYARGENSESVERLINPLGLVAKGSVWYVVGAVDGYVRTYRVSRISQAEVLDEAAPIPVDFNLAEYWEQSASTFKSGAPKYLASFWVSPAVVLRLSFAGRFARVKETDEIDARGWKKVQVGFDVEEMACEYAVSFGPNLEVIEPLTLREKVFAGTTLLTFHDTSCHISRIKSATVRADRLLSIVLLLQANHQMTSRDLASRLEVSERTIHRDMEALSGAGIPVTAARGSGGGWSLLGDYRTSLTGLNEAEIQSLFLTKPAKFLAEFHLDKSADGALLKFQA
jgi:predicted DNA-binding transcriptional regulator YafY